MPYTREKEGQPTEPSPANEVSQAEEQVQDSVSRLMNRFKVDPTFFGRIINDSVPINFNNHVIIPFIEDSLFLCSIDGEKIKYVNKTTANEVVEKTDSLNWSTFRINTVKDYHLRGSDILLITFNSSPCTGTGCGVDYYLVYDLNTKAQNYLGTYRNYEDTVIGPFDFNNDKSIQFLCPSFPNDLQCLDSCIYKFKVYNLDKNGLLSLARDKENREYFIEMMNGIIVKANWYN